MFEHCNADLQHSRWSELPLVGGRCQPLPLPVGAGRRIWWIRSRGQRRRAGVLCGVLSVVLILISTHDHCLLQNITSGQCYYISICWRQLDIYYSIFAIQVGKGLIQKHNGHLWECQHTQVHTSKCCILKWVYGLYWISPCIVGGALGLIMTSIKHRNKY